MKKIVLYALVIINVLIARPAFTQATDTTAFWHIEDCIKYASEHNIQVSLLRLQQQSYLQDLSAARAQRIPGVSASVNNTWNHANNSTGSNGTLTSQLLSTGSYSVNSSILLWNDNWINNNIRQQQLKTVSADLMVQQALNEITLLITQSYLSILLARENLTYVNDLVNTSEERVKQGEMFYKAGSIARKDLLQLKAQLAGDEYLRVQTENAIRQNILSLKQLLQLPAETAFDIAVPDTVVVASSLIPLYVVRQAALSMFPEIRIGRLGMDIAALDRSKARAGFKPALIASGSMSSGYSDVLTNSRVSEKGYFKQLDNNFYQRLGVTLSIPIFSNRINKVNFEKANIAFRQADLNFQNDQLILSQAVEQAYLNASNAMKSFQAAGLQLEAATESLRILNEQFRLGAASIYDLLQQRNQYVQAVQEYTQAKYTAVLQQKMYEFYMGIPVTQLNSGK